jgi:opacity protein-like surface antigen
MEKEPMQLRKFVLATALAALATPALAQYTPRWYAGIAAGQSKTDGDLVINRESTVVNADPSTISSNFDSRGNAWKVFGGYRFNEIFSVEAHLRRPGRHRLTTSFVGGDPALPGSVTINRKISGFGVDAVFTAPLGMGFAIFGRAGAFRSKLEADATLDGSVVFTNAPGDRTRSTTHNETVAKAGLGADWWFTPNAALRLEWERYFNVGKASSAVGGAVIDRVRRMTEYWLTLGANDEVLTRL